MSRPRILVADDNELVRRTVGRVLVRNHFAAVLTCDGQEAVDAFCAAPDDFALLVLDIRMPGLDGLAALARIRELRPRIPAILYSGYPNSDFGGRLAAGVVFLEKPVASQVLVQTVGQLLAAHAK